MSTQFNQYFAAAATNGWNYNSFANVIALPADSATQSAYAPELPVHSTSHRNYTKGAAVTLRNKTILFGQNYRPIDAHAAIVASATYEAARISIYLPKFN